MKKLIISAILLSSSLGFATSAKPKKYETPKATVHHTDNRSPWDFTLGFGLYNPGTGFGGLGAYRIIDGLIPASTQNDLVFESGFNYISFSDTVLNTTYGYSLLEIPLMARWDFTLLDGRMIVGPRAGLNIYTGSSYIAGGSTINRGGGFNIGLGGHAIYYFTENFGMRANLSVGGYTTLMIGINYTPGNF